MNNMLGFTTPHRTTNKTALFSYTLSCHKDDTLAQTGRRKRATEAHILGE